MKKKGPSTRKARRRKVQEYEWRNRGGAPMRAPHNPTRMENRKRHPPQTDWHKKLFGRDPEDY